MTSEASDMAREGETRALAGPGAVARALTIDVEEFFHAGALAEALPRAGWGGLQSRVERTTGRVLAVLADAGAKGTFFTLGSVARKHPRLIREIVAAGHEIACHGDDHFRVTDQTAREFAADVSRARKALEDAAGRAVIGYRAANFSIDPTTWWAFDVLEEAGFRFSSSLYPVVHDHYGLPGGPRRPFRPSRGELVEIPVSTAEVFGRRLPAGGGGYFRLFPYACFKWVFLRACADGQGPANFYFHPWEIDPDQPRAAVRGLSRLRHYVNLAKMEGKLVRLLADFRWSCMSETYREALVNWRDLESWRPTGLPDARGGMPPALVPGARG